LSVGTCAHAVHWNGLRKGLVLCEEPGKATQMSARSSVKKEVKGTSVWEPRWDLGRDVRECICEYVAGIQVCHEGEWHFLNPVHQDRVIVRLLVGDVRGNGWLHVVIAKRDKVVITVAHLSSRR